MPDKPKAVSFSDADKTGKLPVVGDEPAPSSESLLEELDADDILEVDGVPSLSAAPPSVIVDGADDGPAEPMPDRTLRLDRDEVFRSQGVRIPTAPITTPILVHKKESIAPIALDVPSAAPTSRRSSIIPPPRFPLGLVVGGGAVAAAVLGLIGLAAGLALGGGSASASRGAAGKDLGPNRREPVVVAANSATIETSPQTAPAKEDPPPDAPDPAADPAAAANAPAATSTALAELPSADVGSLPTAPPVGASPPPSRVARGTTTVREKDATSNNERPAPAPAAKSEDRVASAPPRVAPAAPVVVAPQGYGVVRLPPDSNVLTLVIDGNYRRVHDGAVAVRCGTHSIRASGMAHDVDVPCGGSVTLE